MKLFINRITSFMMLSSKHHLIAVCIIALSASIAGAEDGAPAKIDFNLEIRPILSNKCFRCHGFDGKKRKAKLRLDTFEGATRDLGGHAAIVPGKPELSSLMERIEHHDPDERMPPPEAKNPISKAEIAVLKRWINEGAEYKGHWAFIPVAETGVPMLRRDRWPRNNIDHFVLSRLKAKKVKPRDEAPRETLIRRLSFDLTGLPPTLAEIDDFLNDSSDRAYEKVVDRLLASERYGERMANDWLDVARYADTHGYQTDTYRDTWQWRNWVIRAFNDNLPYSDFVTWQLAGDLLPGATRDQRLATAFNRLHRQTNEGGSIEEEFRIEYVADRVETFGAAFLGLTMGCARCHDHKYDPITQKNFYQFSAFFNSISESGLYSYYTAATPTPGLRLSTDAQARNLSQAEAGVTAAEAQLRAMRNERRNAFAEWLTADSKEPHGGQAQWEAAQRPPKTAKWTALADESATSRGGQTLTVQADGSWLASGKKPNADVYTVTGTHAGGTITALRLESLPHATLTGGRASRSANSSFILTGIELHAESADGRKSAEFAAASADYQQSGWAVAKVLDGDTKTGWAADTHVRTARSTALFQLKTPLSVAAGTKLSIVIRHETVHAHHIIGCFRVRVTTDKHAKLPLTDGIEQVLATPPGERSADDQRLLRARYEHHLMPGHIAHFPIESTAMKNLVKSGQNGGGHATVVEGRFSKALKLTGDDGIGVGAIGNFSRNDPFSISLWLKTPTVMDRAVILQRSRSWTDAGSRGYQLLIEEGKLSVSLVHFWPGSAIGIQTRTMLPVDKWQQVTFSYDGSSRADGLLLYINGKRADCEIVVDRLHKNITGGGGDHIVLGNRNRDRGFKNGLIDELRVFNRQLSAIEVQQLHDGKALVQALNARQNDVLLDYYLLTVDDDYRKQLTAVRNARVKRSQAGDGITEIMVMEELPQPRPTYLLQNGAYDKKGEQVSRDTPAAVLAWDKTWPRNRLGLARWLTDPRNPLTARVAVNRLWQLCFGEGITATPNDLGSQGATPTHPLLLDWLAKRFMDSGWNVKGMLKLMVMSSTYRQNSEAPPKLLAEDPHNKLLARGPKHRLSAEMIRDNALAVSGLLVQYYGENIALRGTATMEPGPGWGHVPQRAIDGNSGTYAQSASPVWDLKIDLHRAYPIDKIQINSSSPPSACASEYTIKVSADNENWTTVHTATNAQDQLRLIEFDKIDAQYVWMDVTNVNHTLPFGHAILEFKIFLPGAVGGPPARPYQPAGLWKEKTLGGAYVRDRGAGLYRRSLYTIWKRTSPPPSMVTFDASRRSFCVMKRQTTTTPLQALVLMNDPQYVEAGRKLAERMLTEGGASVRDQLQFAFRLLTSRHASDRELDVLENLYQTQVTRFDGDTKSRDALLTVGDSRAAASLPKSPLAAHAVVAGMLMSYDQCVMKR